MIDDRVFGALILFLGSALAVTKFIDDYGYNKLISDLRTAIMIILGTGILILTLIWLIQRLIKSRMSRQKKEIIPNPLKEKPKIGEEFTTEEEPSKIELKDETEIIEVKPEKVAEIEDIKIELDEDIKFYGLKSLNKHEIEYLKDDGFIIRTRFNPFNRRKEKYIFLKNDNESEQHFLVTQFIFNYLKKKVDKIDTYETVKPDIVFELNKKKFAIEVETGKILRHNKSNLIEKIKTLKIEYEDWFFVVTNRNIASKYRKYGKAFDTRYIKNQIDKFLKNLTQI